MLNNKRKCVIHVIAYGSIIEIAQRPENTEASNNKTKFFKLRFKCAKSIANMPCLDQSKDPTFVTRTRKVRRHQGTIKARSLMYDKHLIN